MSFSNDNLIGLGPPSLRTMAELQQAFAKALVGIPQANEAADSSPLQAREPANVAASCSPLPPTSG